MKDYIQYQPKLLLLKNLIRQYGMEDGISLPVLIKLLIYLIVKFISSHLHILENIMLNYFGV